ncbi:hypothetical protein GCM10011517_04150 [Actibacterium pelagium]|uniref:Uncharacterized protein n=1 Tax=Actibacterium pelagium TaxID=2029103 RepID=A0A917AD47_9RHOB|nr:hypothetical protein GCM10011517_04150 [Actibacterium pelagium]
MWNIYWLNTLGTEVCSKTRDGFELYIQWAHFRFRKLLANDYVFNRRLFAAAQTS